jgi:hypothetical protein
MTVSQHEVDSITGSIQDNKGHEWWSRYDTTLAPTM